MPLSDVHNDHPDRATLDVAQLEAAIQAAGRCSSICNLCADSDLRRDASAMRDCIKRCIDCAAVCATTASILSRPSPGGHAWERLLEACAAYCDECAEECAHHDDVCCQQCAAACRECAEACRALLAVAD